MTALATALLATRNDGKLRELLPLFANASLSLMTLVTAGITESDDEHLLEAFDTFELNALAKARWFARLAPDHVVFADDSGLEVDALNGRPGVHSKRWSGRSDLHGASLDEANNAFLLTALARASSAGRAMRSARYVCAAACVWNGGELVVRGTCEGTLLSARRGDGGFGYDPYFLSHDLQATFAEAPIGEKQRVSHRARAFGQLLSMLRDATDRGRKWSAPVDPA